MGVAPDRLEGATLEQEVPTMANDKSRLSRASLADRAPQSERHHPDPWARDLNPERRAGQNLGQRHADDDPRVRTAAHVKDLTRRLQDFTMDELREIPVLPVGARLEQGGTYLDLNDPDRKPFTATGGMVARQGSLIVPKREVAHPYWSRLVGAV